MLATNVNPTIIGAIPVLDLVSIRTIRMTVTKINVAMDSIKIPFKIKFID